MRTCNGISCTIRTKPTKLCVNSTMKVTVKTCTQTWADQFSVYFFFDERKLSNILRWFGSVGYVDGPRFLAFSPQRASAAPQTVFAAQRPCRQNYTATVRAATTEPRLRGPTTNTHRFNDVTDFGQICDVQEVDHVKH